MGFYLKNIPLELGEGSYSQLEPCHNRICLFFMLSGGITLRIR